MSLLPAAQTTVLYLRSRGQPATRQERIRTRKYQQRNAGKTGTRRGDRQEVYQVHVEIQLRGCSPL